LKKKDSQLSFLHCYHHGGMLLGSYYAFKWIPGGSLLILGILNAFVHGVMYSYYYITAFKPELKQSIWWKKYITQIQLTQFALIFAAFLSSALYDCGFPKYISWILVVQSTFMLVMFGDFYIKAYIKVNKKKA
jgi:elongation of very long chain fatty acids protein 7